jgi:AraC-like DNA-binding protein
MIYRLRLPQPPLSYFVENLWFYEDLVVEHTREKLLPDASMELVIDLREGPKKLYDREQQTRHAGFNRCWVSGMQRQYIVIGAESGSSMMGVHFRTAGAAPFFGFPLSELSGEVVELDLIWKREILALREQLMETPTMEGKFDLLEAYLLRKAQNRLEPDRTVAALLASLDTWPVLKLRDLASHVGLSHKEMLGRFDCRVGLTPKFTSRILRFRKTLNAICAAPAETNWAELAADCGYYDQAHLIHEFQEFAAVTPVEYQRNHMEFPLYLALD